MHTVGGRKTVARENHVVVGAAGQLVAVTATITTRYIPINSISQVSALLSYAAKCRAYDNTSLFTE